MRSDDKILGVSIFASIKVSVMAMKEVNCELLCHFKEKLLLSEVFSL